MNWSCQTHPSIWGGAMWWCCGKKQRESAGCKFSKHCDKDKEEDYEDLSTGENRKLCLCCFKHGHLEKDCPLEPNI